MLDKAVENANIEMILVNKNGDIVFGNKFFVAHHDYDAGRTTIYDLFIELTHGKWEDEWAFLQKNGSNKYDTFVMQLEGHANNYEIRESMVRILF